MKEIKFEIFMEVDDDFAEKAKRWEHHANELLNLDSYPEIKNIYGCKVEEVQDLENEIDR